MKLTVEKLVMEYGYSRAAAEQEVKRAYCEHEYDGVWMHTFMGCTKTCTKCGQMTCDPNHCGQYERRTTEATHGNHEKGKDT